MRALQPHAAIAAAIGLFSVMRMTERIKELTIEGASEAEIGEAAQRGGHAHRCARTGLLKVRAGMTSIEEVARVST